MKKMSTNRQNFLYEGAITDMSIYIAYGCLNNFFMDEYNEIMRNWNQKAYVLNNFRMHISVRIVK